MDLVVTIKEIKGRCPVYKLCHRSQKSEVRSQINRHF